jgi:hypothetical protein
MTSTTPSKELSRDDAPAKTANRIGLLAIFLAIASLVFHYLYGYYHWPLTVSPQTLDILHITSVILAAMALTLSLLCLLKKRRWRWTAFTLSALALLNSFVCF